MVSNRAGGIDFPPWGIRGGMGGGVSRFIVNPGTPDERVLPSMSDGTMLKAGDILRIETGGGGGWGDPFEREPERVREDVRGGIVSRHSAERDYGVILHGPDLEVDEAATARLRRSRPPAAGLFHRRGYMETLT
jgi:N-methylhydantoinase B